MPNPDIEDEGVVPAASERKRAAPVVRHVIVLYNLERDEIEDGWVFRDAAARDAVLVDVRECDNEVTRAIAGTDTDGRLVLIAPPGWIQPRE